MTSNTRRSECRMNRCSEKNCPFPAGDDGDDLCAYHQQMFLLDISPSELNHGATHENYVRAGLSIIRRGDYGRQVFAATGLCVRCGATREPNRKHCAECLRYDRFRKMRKVAKGLCRKCGRPLDKKRTRCSACLKKESAASIARYRSKLRSGRCTQCGRPHPDGRNRGLCSTCRAMQTSYQKRYRYAAVALHLCYVCRKPIEPDNSTKRCVRCRWREREQRRKVSVA